MEVDRSWSRCPRESSAACLLIVFQAALPACNLVSCCSPQQLITFHAARNIDGSVQATSCHMHMSMSAPAATCTCCTRGRCRCSCNCAVLRLGMYLALGLRLTH
jgi:hypothetical protein